jgi:hypothetical protein
MTSQPTYVAEFLDRDAAERFAGVLRRRGVVHVAVVPDGARPGAWWAVVSGSEGPLAERVRDELQKG